MLTDLELSPTILLLVAAVIIAAAVHALVAWLLKPLFKNLIFKEAIKNHADEYAAAYKITHEGKAPLRVPDPWYVDWILRVSAVAVGALGGWFTLFKVWAVLMGIGIGAFNAFIIKVAKAKSKSL
jgi:hypothetical protein